MAKQATQSTSKHHGFFSIYSILLLSLALCSASAILNISRLKQHQTNSINRRQQEPEATESNADDPPTGLNIQIHQDQETEPSRGFVSRLRENGSFRLRDLQESLRERLDNIRSRSSESKDESSVYQFNLDLPTVQEETEEQPAESTSSLKYSNPNSQSNSDLSRRESYLSSLQSGAHRLLGFQYFSPKLIPLPRARRASGDDRASDLGHHQQQVEQNAQPNLPMRFVSSESLNSGAEASRIEPAWSVQPSEPLETRFGMRSFANQVKTGNPLDANHSPQSDSRNLAIRGGEAGEVKYDEPASDSLRPAGTYDHMVNYAEPYEHHEKGGEEYEVPVKKVIIARKDERHHHHYHHHHHTHDVPKKSEGHKKHAPPMHLEIHIKDKGKNKSKSKSKSKSKGKKKDKGKGGEVILVKLKGGEHGKGEKYGSASGDGEEYDHKEGDYLVDDKVSLLNDKDEANDAQVESKPLSEHGPDTPIGLTEESSAEESSKTDHPKDEPEHNINTSEVPGQVHEDTPEVTGSETKKEHKHHGSKKSTKRKEKKITEEVEFEEVEEKKRLEPSGEEHPLQIGEKPSPNQGKVHAQPRSGKKVEKPKKVEKKKVEKVEKAEKVEKVEKVEPTKAPVKHDKKEGKLHVNVKLDLDKSKHHHIEVHEHKHFENHQHINLNEHPAEEEKITVQEVGHHHDWPPHHEAHLEEHGHGDQEMLVHHAEHGIHHGGHHDMHHPHHEEHHHHEMPIKEQWLMPQMQKPNEKHPLGSFVIEDNSELHDQHHHGAQHHGLGYMEEVANHPHGFGLSPAGVRPLMGAFATQVNVHTSRNSTMMDRSKNNTVTSD